MSEIFGPIDIPPMPKVLKEAIVDYDTMKWKIGNTGTTGCCAFILRLGGCVLIFYSETKTLVVQGKGTLYMKIITALLCFNVAVKTKNYKRKGTEDSEIEKASSSREVWDLVQHTVQGHESWRQ